MWALALRTSELCEGIVDEGLYVHLLCSRDFYVDETSMTNIGSITL